eukprot:3466427-Amphidinium_carterae.1
MELQTGVGVYKSAMCHSLEGSVLMQMSTPVLQTLSDCKCPKFEGTRFYNPRVLSQVVRLADDSCGRKDYTVSWCRVIKHPNKAKYKRGARKWLQHEVCLLARSCGAML